jgi:hypothetical protein
MATTDVTQTSLIYHTLSELNTGFAAIVPHIAADRIVQIKSGKTVFQFHARAAGLNEPGVS